MSKTTTNRLPQLPQLTATPGIQRTGGGRRTWNCPRTCPYFERVDLCRFSAMLTRLGVVGRVTSETVTVDIEFSDPDALGDAVETMGGNFLGHGDYQLFQSGAAGQVTGFGFTLPGWQYPLVATSAGQLAYDDYEGRWGNPADIDRLRDEYGIAAAGRAATMLGWHNERVQTGDGHALRVYHPSGGYLDVSEGGTVEAFGFNGVGCHEAAGQLAGAMGTPVAHVAKPEMGHVAVENRQLGGQ